jgi:hypothetical protein
VSVTVKNGTSRQGLAAQVTTGLRRLGFKAGNGGNATPSATTTVSHAPGAGGTAATLAAAVQNGRPVARATRPGLGPTAVVLVLGADFKRLAGKVVVPKPPPPKPPKPTRATRGLPSWDPAPADRGPGRPPGRPTASRRASGGISKLPRVAPPAT